MADNDKELEIDDSDDIFAEKPRKKEAPQKAESKPVLPEDKVPIFALRTTANREEQVMDFIKSNVEKKNKDAAKSSGAKERLEVYSLIHPHGMRGYIFMEAKNRQDGEQA